MLIPEENTKDIAELPNSVKNGLEIIPVSRMDQVLTHALTRQPVPIEWDENEEVKSAPVPSVGDDEAGSVVAH